MAMMENGNGEWSEGLEEELIRELLDEESPEVIESEPTLLMNSAMINFLASKVYSGPTIRDIQEALSITNRDAEASDQSNIMGSGNLVLDDDLGSQSERRFTLEIKCSGNGAADDGYKWRKYGQKSIKNSSYPRSYYKCTIPRCGAKKQVERSSKDPNTLVITYEGLHFHFAYSHFLQPQTHQHHSPTKKLKKNSSHSKAQKGIETHIQAEESPLIVKSTVRRQDHFIKNVSSQGSLQDVVPLMILKP